MGQTASSTMESSSQPALATASSAVPGTTENKALPWFQTTFCKDLQYRSGNTAVVPWLHFCNKLHELACSKDLNEVCWSFVDHRLSQPAQKLVFQANLWAHCKVTDRNTIAVGEFEAVVELFSPESGSMADLIESIMRDTPGSLADTNLRLRDQVFLSHTGADKALGSVSLTSALYHELSDNRQLATFFDTHTLEPGDTWRHKLERFVQSSKVYVVVLSPSFMSSYWCMRELDLALHADPQPGSRAIFPVLLGVGHNFTEQLAEYREVWRGFRQLTRLPDAEEVLDRWERNLQLLTGWQSVDASPYATSSGKDWESKLAREIAAKIQQRHQLAPLLGLDVQPPQQQQCNVHPNLPLHNVVNQAAFEHLTSSIEAACSRQAASPQPLVLQVLGMAGMGKSVLALQVAKHYEKTVGPFNGSVHFLRAPPKPAQAVCQADRNGAVMELQRSLLGQLRPGLTATCAANPDDLHRELTLAFQSAPSNRFTHLLVLDDVWDKAMIKQLCCDTMRGVIVVTAREPVRYDIHVSACDQLLLQPDDSSRKATSILVGRILDRQSADQEAVINKILDKCDGNMLAAAIVAQALVKRASQPQYWHADVLERFRAVLDNEEQLHNLGYTIHKIIETSVQTVSGDQAIVLEMLKMFKCRLLLPSPMLQLAWDFIRPEETPLCVSSLLEDLVNRCLLCKSKDECYYAHALVDEVLESSSEVHCALPIGNAPPSDGGDNLLSWLRAWLGLASHPEPPAAATAPRKLNKLAVLLLGYGRHHATLWAQKHLGLEVPADARPITCLGQLKTLAQSVADDGFTVEPQGKLFSALAIVYDQDGQYETSAVFQKQALGYLQQVLDPEHPDTAKCLNNLANLLRDQGKLAEAEPMFRQALGIRQRVLGPEHPDTAAYLNNLANLSRDQGKLAEAEPLYRQALGIWQKVLGPEHPDTATSLNNLALLLEDQGKLAEAEPLYRQALGIRQKVLGPEHPDTATSLNNLAALLRDQRKLAEAEPMNRQALGIRQKVLGPEHPDTAISFNNLALLLEDQGKLAEAEPLYRLSLGILQKVLGLEHPNTAQALNNLANLSGVQGKLAEAEAMYRQALGILQKVLGPEHPLTAKCHCNLAIWLRAQGKVAEAEPMYRQALGIQQKALGPEHPDTASTLNNLANLLREQGKLAEAEPMYRQALCIHQKVLGPEHEDTAITLSSLAILLSDQGKLVEAETMSRQALGIMQKMLSPEHLDTATSLKNLATMLGEQGKLAEAERIFRVIRKSSKSDVAVSLQIQQGQQQQEEQR